jgi:Rrf2 family transcriptional regulator, nitric oxide-sensitive transcriptional repressor
MALKVIAMKPEGALTSAKEVVEQTGCPFDPAARVMQILAQKGILRSEQGAHGGYLLVRDLRSVSYLELTEIVLGPMGVARCLQNEETCELQATCNIITPMSVLNKRLSDFYARLSVGELLLVPPRAKVSEVSP